MLVCERERGDIFIYIYFSAKLKAASQEELIHMWKEHFKYMLVKYPKVTDKPMMKIINN